jgi:murein DD-endopeptidase MepM/ murein hydrolase activator NlpD
VRRFLVVVVTAAVTALMLSAVAIHFLYREVTDLDAGRVKIQVEHDRLLDQNRELDESIQRQNLKLAAANRDLEQVTGELETMTDNLAGIESLIGLRPPSDAVMIERLDVASQTALEKVLMLQNIPSGYPLEFTKVNSSFGMRSDPKTGKKRFHQGIDLKAEEGAPVYATADGIVEFAGADKASGFGTLLVIVHNFGFKTYYAHLNSVAVKPGDFVGKGQQVAESGSTGRTTGPNLHYEVRRLQGKLNPKPFMEWNIENYATLFEQEKRVPWDSLAKAVKRSIATATPQLSRKESKSMAN